jgi:dihydrofolate reductase
MAPSLSLYIAATLDGFIARTDGSIDWLADIDENNTDYGYTPFYSSVDGVIMGSTTFELIQSFGPWPYSDKPTFVFTRRSLQTEIKNVFFVSGDPRQLLLSSEFEKFRKIWLVGGSALIASCLKKDMIDDFVLTILPLILGHGLRLFSSPISEQWLTMVACQQYEGGVLQIHYRKKSENAGASDQTEAPK